MLLGGGEELREPRGASDHQRQNAGRHWVERAQVPNLARAREPPHAIDHIMRRQPLRFVDNDHAIHATTVTSDMKRKHLGTRLH